MVLEARRTCRLATVAIAILAVALVGTAVAYYSLVKVSKYATLFGERIVITGEADIDSTQLLYLDGSWLYLVEVKSNLDHEATFTVRVYFNDVDLGARKAEIPPDGTHVFYFNTGLQQLPDDFTMTICVYVAENGGGR